jgi:hypothetical protein
VALLVPEPVEPWRAIEAARHSCIERPMGPSGKRDAHGNVLLRERVNPLEAQQPFAAGCASR